AFTMASMYKYDGVEQAGAGAAAPLDHSLLDQLIAHDGKGLDVDARAVQQVERRLRGVGRPPRTTPEMAEWLRRVGDVSAGELEGRMAGFVRELESQGVVCEIALPGVTEPVRWILTEEAELYRNAFGAAEPDAEPARQAGLTILRRYLQTH